MISVEISVDFATNDLSDTPRSGPVKFNDDVLTSLVQSDARLSVRELSGSVGSIVQRHLEEIGKVHRSKTISSTPSYP